MIGRDDREVVDNRIVVRNDDGGKQKEEGFNPKTLFLCFVNFFIFGLRFQGVKWRWSGRE
jgi:hypothetical protein